jgi:hypothetical protein
LESHIPVKEELPTNVCSQRLQLHCGIQSSHLEEKSGLLSIVLIEPAQSVRSMITLTIKKDVLLVCFITPIT